MGDTTGEGAWSGKLSARELPRGALLARYQSTGNYTDCYAIRVPFHVALTEYIGAFYSTPLFNAERLVLKVFAKPSSTEDIAALAHNDSERFAAWTVEARTRAQVLLKDDTGRTRSWLHCQCSGSAQDGSTALYFGSAVVFDGRSVQRSKSSAVMRALIPVHRLYSRGLLQSAARKLTRNRIQAAVR